MERLEIIKYFLLVKGDVKDLSLRHIKLMFNIFVHINVVYINVVLVSKGGLHTDVVLVCKGGLHTDVVPVCKGYCTLMMLQHTRRDCTLMLLQYARGDCTLMLFQYTRGYCSTQLRLCSTNVVRSRKINSNSAYTTHSIIGNFSLMF